MPALILPTCDHAPHKWDTYGGSLQLVHDTPDRFRCVDCNAEWSAGLAVLFRERGYFAPDENIGVWGDPPIARPFGWYAHQPHTPASSPMGDPMTAPINYRW